MILIADSGSTKTDWALLSGDEVKKFETPGINPSAETNLYDLAKSAPELVGLQEKVREIFYYGAGVINQKTAQAVQVWLEKYFHSVKVINVTSDMVGACKATANNSKAIISILGTGSNSCLYDGQEIIDNIPALGYSLSNEGGGSEIGKAILQSYFYRKMPDDVNVEFETMYQVDKGTVVNALYNEENPTGYLASFASFISETKNEKWKKEILSEQFQKFVDIRIKSYSDYSSYQLHFVGSIAYFCRDVLKEILQNNNLEAISIHRKPIDGLIDFHKKR